MVWQAKRRLPKITSASSVSEYDEELQRYPRFATFSASVPYGLTPKQRDENLVASEAASEVLSMLSRAAENLDHRSNLSNTVSLDDQREYWSRRIEELTRTFCQNHAAEWNTEHVSEMPIHDLPLEHEEWKDFDDVANAEEPEGEDGVLQPFYKAGHL